MEEEEPDFECLPNLSLSHSRSQSGSIDNAPLDVAKLRPTLEILREQEDLHGHFPSPNSYYKDRQNRFTVPVRLMGKLNEDNEITKPMQQHQEEVLDLLMLSNQIRALCEKDNGRTKVTKILQERMSQLNEFSDKYLDELWKRSNDVDVHKCITDISESLIEAKRVLEDALKQRFRRNSTFGPSLKDINIDIGNRIASLEMTITGEEPVHFGHLSTVEKRANKASRGELQCIAGHRSYFGHGTTQNYQHAFECYRKSAELGNADGMNHLASMYEKGVGCILNMEEAIRYYKAAVELKSLDARYNLGTLYYHHPIYDDVPAAIGLFRKAAEGGHLAAQTKLASLYESGVEKHLQPNIQTSIKWYRKAATEGYLEAKNNLAVILLKNSDVDSKEYHQAITLLTEASQAGHAPSQNNLGHCYEFGKGVEKNDARAVEWYKKSASQGHSASFINLGYLQMKRREYGAAFEQFSNACKDGSIDSWYYLGLMHEKGYYVPLNVFLAFDYFQKASREGHVLATLKIGDCYFSGSGGTARDYKKAYEIYLKLAMDGNPVAANNLGIMYEEGLGTEVDTESAEMWYNMASQKENPDAARNSERLSLLLGKSEL